MSVNKNPIDFGEKKKIIRAKEIKLIWCKTKFQKRFGGESFGGDKPLGHHDPAASDITVCAVSKAVLVTQGPQEGDGRPGTVRPKPPTPNEKHFLPISTKNWEILI